MTTDPPFTFSSFPRTWKDILLAPVFIISREQERYNICRNRARKAGFIGHIQNAPGVNRDDQEEIDSNWKMHPFLAQHKPFGQHPAAVMLAHLNLWKSMLDLHIPYAVIFEDDVLFHTEWHNLAHQYYQATPSYKRYNLLCAISANKVIGWKLYPERKGGVKTTDILEFYDEFIKDKYKNHLVIMDNAVIHKSKIIRETIENSKNELLYSVPYHPETNSIEEFFSQLKHYIKKESPNTYEDIYNTIKEILETKITKEHLTNYLKHSYKIYK